MAVATFGGSSAPSACAGASIVVRDVDAIAGDAILADRSEESTVSVDKSEKHSYRQ